MTSRNLDWPACFNTRDLGGLPAAGGRTTRHGALVRSDTLAALVPAGRDALVAHGVRTVVDLRSADELESRPIAPLPGVDVLHVPALGDESATTVSWVAGGPATDAYRLFLDRFRSGFANAVAAVATAPPGGVAVACHAGRDRTGVTIALLLELAGVEREAIAADYAESRDPFTARAAALGEEERVAWLAAFHARGWAAPETILYALRHVDERYGGAAAYVGNDGHAGHIRAGLLA